MDPNSENELKNYLKLAEVLSDKISEHTTRTAKFLNILQNHGVLLKDLSESVFAPKIVFKLQSFKHQGSRVGLQKQWLCVFLTHLRGHRTYVEMAQMLNLGTPSTYHHWESGRRDIPLAYWFMAIDKATGRLEALLSTMPFKVSLLECGFKNRSPILYEEFFSQPWTPSILLALQIPKVKNASSIKEQILLLRQMTKIQTTDIENSLDVLTKMGMIEIKDSKFFANPGQFYAIPSIPPQRINEIHKYWFHRSEEMLSFPGYHKVEQHALTHESKEKIIGWIAELRDRIRQEVNNNGAPETIIHIGWQVAEFI
ncbi:MAG TPA: DUF4423 domain-containing protein [Pseudobdellovibrionaceae bacterium]|nr:DUF4423 domain-containing protein [Pseudobdellovibrionaceae bacterium]